MQQHYYLLTEQDILMVRAFLVYLLYDTHLS